MIIRNSKKSDFKQMYEILNKTQELRGFEDGEAYSKSWLKNVISDNKNNILLIAEENKDFAGFLIAHVLADKDIFLNDIYVKKEYRNKGVASKLLSELDKIGKKIKSKFSMGFVMISNDKMQNFFEKHNYSKGQTFHYYYKGAK